MTSLVEYKPLLNYEWPELTLLAIVVLCTAAIFSWSFYWICRAIFVKPTKEDEREERLRPLVMLFNRRLA